MRRKKYKIACFIMAVLTVISGMCLEGGKADSSFEYALPETADSYFVPTDSAFTDAQLCTPEMLGIYSHNAGLGQLTGRFIGSGREVKQISDFLCQNLFSPEEGKFFTGSQRMQFYHPCQDELVANYIQKSDGKKRS